MRPEPDERVRARRLAMDLLARREHSTLELERKLLARGFARDLIEEVLAGLSRDKLLSEPRFAEAFVQGRLRKGKGPLRIMSELRQRGIAGETAQAALDEAKPDWVSLAADALRKRFGERAIDDFRERARRARFLGQRGFSADQIRQVLGGSDN